MCGGARHAVKRAMSDVYHSLGHPLLSVTVSWVHKSDSPVKSRRRQSGQIPPPFALTETVIHPSAPFGCINIAFLARL